MPRDRSRPLVNNLGYADAQLAFDIDQLSPRNDTAPSG